MSEKEIAMELLNRVPADKLGYVIAYMQGITADDYDDAYCEALVDEYETDSDKGQFISMEEMAELSGVDFDAL